MRPKAQPLRSQKFGFRQPSRRPLRWRAAFSGLALANIVLIPHDRRSDVAAARFVESAQTDRIAAHIAVELCSMLGAWSSMKGHSSTIGPIRPPVGMGHRSCFFDRLCGASFTRRCRLTALSRRGLSRCRKVSCRARIQRQLFAPSPTQSFLMNFASTEIKLRLGAKRFRLEKLFVKFPKRSGRPCAAFRECFVTVSPDLESLQGDGLQDLVGGEASWLHIDYRDRFKPIRMPGRGLSRRETRSMISKRATKCLPSGSPMTCGSALLNFPSQ